MLDLLSDVFEFDVDTTSDSIHLGPLFLKLCEKEPSLENINNNGIIFSFKVKSDHELREIMNKYNFFLYRKSEISKVQEKIELRQSEDKTTLTISDLDQRLWRFELDGPFGL